MAEKRKQEILAKTSAANDKKKQALQAAAALASEPNGAVCKIFIPVELHGKGFDLGTALKGVDEANLNYLRRRFTTAKLECKPDPRWHFMVVAEDIETLSGASAELLDLVLHVCEQAAEHLKLSANQLRELTPKVRQLDIQRYFQYGGHQTALPDDSMQKKLSDFAFSESDPPEEEVQKDPLEEAQLSVQDRSRLKLKIKALVDSQFHQSDEQVVGLLYVLLRQYGERFQHLDEKQVPLLFKQLLRKDLSEYCASLRAASAPSEATQRLMKLTGQKFTVQTPQQPPEAQKKPEKEEREEGAKDEQKGVQETRERERPSEDAQTPLKAQEKTEKGEARDDQKEERDEPPAEGQERPNGTEGQREPEQGQPELEEPEQQEPEQEKPEQKEPEQKEPEQEQPEQKEPEQEKQEGPEQEQPEQKEPEQTEPKQKEPEQEEPQQEEPQQEEIEQTEIEQEEPEPKDLEQEEPEQEELQQKDPDQEEPEQEEPEQQEPEQVELEQKEPEQHELVQKELEQEEMEPVQKAVEQKNPEQEEPDQEELLQKLVEEEEQSTESKTEQVEETGQRKSEAAAHGTVSSLLGAYGSPSEEESEEPAVKKQKLSCQGSSSDQPDR
ncbi:unnamed protein product, partial [Polarella glacialis]